MKRELCPTKYYFCSSGSTADLVKGTIAARHRAHAELQSRGSVTCNVIDPGDIDDSSDDPGFDAILDPLSCFSPQVHHSIKISEGANLIEYYHY